MLIFKSLLLNILLSAGYYSSKALYLRVKNRPYELQNIWKNKLECQ